MIRATQVGSSLGERVFALFVTFVFAAVAAAADADANIRNLGPVAVVAAKDGKRLFVANADAKQIAVVDVAWGKVTRSMAMPARPTGMVLGPAGTKLYVTCAAPKSTVVVLDAASGRKLASIPTGHTAVSPAIAPDGKLLYVCNRFDNAVAVIDLMTNRETARIATTRQPIAAAITPDGKTVFVANHLPLARADVPGIAAAVTAIDTASKRTTSIRLPDGSTSLRGLCVSPDGKYVYTVHVLSRNQMPTTQIERGWVNTNAMTVIDANTKKWVNTVLFDDIDRGAANPWSVACTPDGASICITHAGTHELSVIDANGLLKKLLDKRNARKAAQAPNDLAFLKTLRRRIPLQGGVNGPRGLAVAGAKAWSANYFSDNLSQIDLNARPAKPASTIPLGRKPKMTPQRRGEMLFNDATLCFQHWHSCATCHPDARVDGLGWDLLSGGMGNQKNTTSMLLAHKPPMMVMKPATHRNAKRTVRARIRHLLFSIRPEADAAAIDAYLKSVRPVPSPHLVDGKPSPAARRGRKLFFDKTVGCAKCHPKPIYTDLSKHDVASAAKHDRQDTFETPTLIECWRTAPYMHDGQYTTIKELLTKGKHGNKGGKLDKFTDRQIDDLVEFVLSL